MQINGVLSSVVPVQDATGYIWLFPLVSLCEAMGLTVTPSPDSLLHTISQDVEGEDITLVVLTFSLDHEGLPTDILLWKDNLISEAPGVTLILYEGILYASTEFVQYGLNHTVTVETWGIELNEIGE